ncbi:NAD(P)-dependent oxidoreductase [Sorangium sp. So ce233]|uniref:NAD(P)-dependent oxidoreductase n=1 Tax=Sorangium sp. So ce233 TaxID=3133290 RepID=UPI003F613442
MRLLLLGATGRTGEHLLDLGLARGHHLTAFVRSPQKIARRERALTVVKGDPLQADQLAGALAGHDAVLSALGPSPRQAFRPSTMLSECAASTVAAMTTAGVERLAVVSAALLFPEKGLRFVLFRWLLEHHVRDLDAMEAVVRASRCDFTIARPPRLVDARDEGYRSARDALPAGADAMSFRAVAAFLLDCVEQRTHVREIVGLARGRDT